MLLAINQVRTDGGTQLRVRTSQSVVRRYKRSLLVGVTFPPITVFYDGRYYWLADGSHRLEAAKRAGKTEIEAEVLHGTRRDAVLFALKANASHGLPFSNADKRRAVTLLLQDGEWQRWSNREIARQCGVDEKTVRTRRRQLCAELPQTRKATRNGTTYDMKTHNSGKHKQEVGQAEQPLTGAAASSRLYPQPGLIPSDPGQGVQAAGPAAQQARAQPPGRFGVLVLAPRWSQVGQERVRAMPVDARAAPDSVVWLWTAGQYLPDALAALRGWGFRYAGTLTWVRGGRATGDGMVLKAQHCVVGVRGKASITLPGEALWQERVADLQELTSFYELVETLCPDPKVAVFLNISREGWGCQADGLQPIPVTPMGGLST
jgi:N6-adenosine-specific RNA methylase IME4/transposase-like protein